MGGGTAHERRFLYLQSVVGPTPDTPGPGRSFDTDDARLS